MLADLYRCGFVRRDHSHGPWGEGLARDGELPADSGLRSADVVLAVREGEIRK